MASSGIMNVRCLILLVASGSLAACSHSSSRALPPEVTRTVEFKEVKPILTNQCLPCHNSGNLLSHFNLETKEKAFRTAPTGPFIVPGYPESSRLWTLLTTVHPQKAEEDLMPSHGPPLTDDEKNLIYRWIEQGAIWPGGEEGRLRPIQDPRGA